MNKSLRQATLVYFLPLFFVSVFSHIFNSTVLVAMSVTGKPTHRLSFEEVPSENGTLPEIKKGTDADAADMTRMGKKQVLRVCVVPLRYH